MKCPVCEGEGGWGEDFGEGTFTFEDCNYCEGKQKVSLRKWIGYHFWNCVPERIFDVYVWLVEPKESVEK